MTQEIRHEKGRRDNEVGKGGRQAGEGRKCMSLTASILSMTSGIHCTC